MPGISEAGGQSVIIIQLSGGFPVGLSRCQATLNWLQKGCSAFSPNILLLNEKYMASGFTSQQVLEK